MSKSSQILKGRISSLWQTPPPPSSIRSQNFILFVGLNGPPAIYCTLLYCFYCFTQPRHTAQAKAKERLHTYNSIFLLFLFLLNVALRLCSPSLSPPSPPPQRKRHFLPPHSLRPSHIGGPPVCVYVHTWIEREKREKKPLGIHFTRVATRAGCQLPDTSKSDGRPTNTHSHTKYALLPPLSLSPFPLLVNGANIGRKRVVGEEGHKKAIQ